MISGILIRDITTGSVFHAIAWFSKRAKGPVKPVASAEVLGTGAAADDELLIKCAYSKVLGTIVVLIVVMNSKDLFDTVLTKRLPTDKAIKGDVALLMYDFERSAIDKIIWIPGKFNLADTMTKRDSAIVKRLQLTLTSSKRFTDFTGCKMNISNKPTG